jgi:DNA-binding transcriptional MerR regulator
MAHNEPGPLRIGDLAQKSGVSRDTLRFYERRGLLPKTQRTAGGFRVYPRETVDRLRFIKQAQMVGLTLQEIAALVSHRNDSGLRRCRRVRDLLRAKVADVETKLSELQAFRTTLSEYLAQCDRTISDSDSASSREAECPVIDTLTRAR